MPKDFEITYKTKNTYDDWVYNAHWQYLVLPIEDETQYNIEVETKNSLYAITENSINGFGFNTLRIQTKKKFKEFSFEVKIKFQKIENDPYNFELELDNSIAFEKLQEVNFKIANEQFLRPTTFTKLEDSNEHLYSFDKSVSIFENLNNLNSWVYNYIQFKTGVTAVGTMLNDVIEKQQGVCQDFAHLFCALARLNNIPARYVSGYLNQGSGYFGDSQMHAWVEAYIPGVGWKGFDPTNNIMANINHIKVCHGKDYNDCAPLRGVILTQGKNTTTHAVTVSSQQ